VLPSQIAYAPARSTTRMTARCEPIVSPARHHTATRTAKTCLGRGPLASRPARPSQWARLGSNQRPLACEAWRSWRRRARKYLQIGNIWPNEWPNGEIHARDDERARGSSKQHERTGVTAGALSGQLAASLPAGLAAANDLTIAIYHRPARGRRAPAGEAWVLAGSPSLTRSSTPSDRGRARLRPIHRSE
jgi:hypothetical protein